MKLHTVLVGLAVVALVPVAHTPRVMAQDQIVHVDLAYRAPGNGPAPNFSPKGMQVALTAVSADAALPTGATRPAKAGTIKIGPDKQAWIPVLATADADHPNDLTRLFIDRNRNGRFDDDGPGSTATPAQNVKTKDWWSSFNRIELSVPYGGGNVEPYLVDVWIVRPDTTAAPDLLRFSVRSWRFGTATINGVDALVAAMDSDNDALFGKNDDWSVIEASAPDAAKAVLSIAEARQTNRLMFVKTASGKEIVLEFQSFSPDGRSVDFAVVDRPVTKAADRAPDDMLKDERPRPRAKGPFAWGHDFDAALAQAKTSNRNVFIDFETTWCGPCKSMDEWIYTDAEVAAALNAGYIGVKLDGDIEKALVKRFAVKGYPTMVLLDAAGTETHRAEGYQSSRELLALLAKK